MPALLFRFQSELASAADVHAPMVHQGVVKALNAPAAAPGTNAWMFLGSDMRRADIRNLPTFAKKVNRRTDPVSEHVWNHFSGSTQELLKNYVAHRQHPSQSRAYDPPMLKALTAELNKLITGESIYTKDRFAGVSLSADTRQLLTQELPPSQVVRLNRLLLEDSYPELMRTTRVLPDTASQTVALVDFKGKFISFYDSQGKELSTVNLARELEKIKAKLPPPLTIDSKAVIDVAQFSGTNLFVSLDRAMYLIDAKTGAVTPMGAD